jgi:hypothetical protein
LAAGCIHGVLVIITLRRYDESMEMMDQSTAGMDSTLSILTMRETIYWGRK